MGHGQTHRRLLHLRLGLEISHFEFDSLHVLYNKITYSSPHPPPPGQNGRLFVDDIFRWIFVNETLCIFFIKLSLKSSMGLDNGLAPDRRQAII